MVQFFVDEFRRHEPEMAKQVSFLRKYCSPSEIEKQRFVLSARAAVLQKKQDKLKNAFSILLQHMLSQSSFNFCIKNLPELGTNKYTNEKEPITAKVMHETMQEFADVRDAVVFNHNAYVEFEDPKSAESTHKLINKMMIEQNIVSTSVCV